MADAVPSIGQTPATRELLRRLDLDVRMKLDGLLHGDYRGLVPGHGSELGETRDYAPGDDVRRIDWNVTARMQATHVRETIADRELETHALVDLSPSVDFGTTQQEKRDLVLAAVAAIGLLTARVGNRFGAHIIGPDTAVSIPPAQGRAHLMAILHRLADAPRGSSGSVDLARGLHRLAGQARRRGLIVVVSDFIAPDGWQQRLARLSTRHDVLAVEVVDPRELEIPDVGLVVLTDPETGVQREVATNRSSVRKRYAEAAKDQRDHIAAGLRDAGVSHLQLRTDRDWILDLAQFMVGRRKRHDGAAKPAARL
ncbi:MAG: DUF58 domain-containing protein [Acidimicrobiales bacterium]